MARKTIRFEEARRKRLKEGKLLQRERAKALLAEERLVKSQFKGEARLIKRKARLIRARSKARKAARISPAKRAEKFGKLAGAFGALPSKGAGRPKGSYKYRIGNRPVSVYEWRKHKAQRKQQLAQFQSQQNQRLRKKGFSPEQLQALRQQQIVSRVQQGKPMTENNIADQELAFREHLAKNTVTPRTQQILVALRRTQNKAKSDNIEHDRRLHERNLVGRAQNMMDAHLNLNPIKLDFTGVNSENVLMAPSVFKENPENNILRPNRLNILQTKEAGNSLFF